MPATPVSGQRNIFEYTHNSYKVVAFAKQSRNPSSSSQSLTREFGLNSRHVRAVLARHVLHPLRRKATELCRRDEVKATAEAHIGCALYMSGQLMRPSRASGMRREILDKVGDWFGMFSHHTLRHIHSVRGDIRSELAKAKQEIALGTARGDDVARFRGDCTARPMAWHGPGISRRPRICRPLGVEELTSLKSNTAGLGLGVLGFVRLQASDYAGRAEGARTLAALALSETLS